MDSMASTSQSHKPRGSSKLHGFGFWLFSGMACCNFTRDMGPTPNSAASLVVVSMQSFMIDRQGFLRFVPPGVWTVTDSSDSNALTTQE